MSHDRAPARSVRIHPPYFWRPNSHDLSPVDCRLWGMMQDRVYQTPVRDVTNLRQRLIDTWNSYIVTEHSGDAIDEWRKRLN